MLHSSITAQYVRHRVIYTRLLRICFMFAGLFWIVIYLQPLEQHMLLRSGQSVIYFILMTLWGLDYMREQRRLTVIIKAANEKGLPPSNIELNDIRQHDGLFTMVVPRAGFWGTVVPVIFSAGLLASIILITMQYLRIVGPQ